MISAVIPHRNSGAHLARCVAALAGATGVDEIVVADEDSTDGSIDGVAVTRARLVHSPGVGFAVAANAGIGAATGERLLLLNSDSFVQPDTVERLSCRLDDEPRLALVGAALVDVDGERTKTYHSLLTLRRALLDAVGIRPALPQEGRGLAVVEAVFPTCALARREALEAVGGFDERFRLYYEDMDLSRRLADAGWLQAVDWDAEAVHVGGGSTKEAGPRRWFRQYHESRLVYLRKHYPHGWVVYLCLWTPKALAHATAWQARAWLRRAQADVDGARIAGEWAASFRKSALPVRRVAG